MRKAKDTLKKLAICIGLLCLIWGVYIYFAKWVIIVPREDDFSWVYQVDGVDLQEDKVILSGFAFQSVGDAVGDNFDIILHDLENNKNHFLKMKYTERNDVNQYFSGQYDYLRSGFEATIQAKKLDMDRSYEIYLRVAGRQKAYQTGTYLVNGQVMYADPTEFVPLDVAGTDLEKIVEQGILRVYRPEYGIYVYQYNNELYWIAESDYAFDETGDTYLQYIMTTTQYEKLPLSRREKGRTNDDRGFSFIEYELVDWNTGKYRVTKQPLAEDYALERIWTGVFTGVWVWRQDFRPYYMLK